MLLILKQQFLTAFKTIHGSRQLMHFEIAIHHRMQQFALYSFIITDCDFQKTSSPFPSPLLYQTGICHTIICEWQTKKDVDTVNQLSIFINTHPRLSLHHRMKRKEADIWQRLLYIMYTRRHWKPSIWRKTIPCRMHTIERCW